MVEIEFNCPENINDLISGVLMLNGYEMSENRKERYCKSCNKTIVDFSKMSNQEIAIQLKKTTSNEKSGNQKNCGIFKTNQIYNPNRSRLTTIFRMAFAAVFLLGLNTSSLFAQDTIPQLVPFINDTLFIKQYTVPPIVKEYHIKGIVTDADGETIPFAKVWTSINGIDHYLKTDLDGIYLLEFSDYNNEPFEIWSKGLGYDTTIVTEVTFPVDENVVEVNIVMQRSGLLVVGVYYDPHILDKDPYSLSKTTITSDDLKHWIR